MGKEKVPPRERKGLSGRIHYGGFLGGVPLQDVLLNNVFVCLKDKLNADDEFIGWVHPFDGALDF